MCVCVYVKEEVSNFIPFSSNWDCRFLRISPTHHQVAEALISGISEGFVETGRSASQEEGGRIHFNFAFDENVFKNAYKQLRAR